MTEHIDSLLSEEALEVKKSPENRFDGLTNQQIWAYGVGHFINDLASTCWFNYLLYFLKEIVKTPAASWAILAGQIADGIATPIVGWLSDRTRTKFGSCLNDSGQRKPWYVGGLLLVIFTFLPTFQNFRKWAGNTEESTG